VAGDAASATFVRSTLPVVDTVAVPAPSTSLRAGSSQSTRRTGHPLLGWLQQFEGRSTPPRPTLGFRNGPALRYVPISRMTVIKNPNLLFRLR
jgi:hypothetical protein